MNYPTWILDSELTVAEDSASRKVSQDEVVIPDPEAEAALEAVLANTKEICNATPARNE